MVLPMVFVWNCITLPPQVKAFNRMFVRVGEQRKKRNEIFQTKKLAVIIVCRSNGTPSIARLGRP
jgi:hypothetical protein